MRIKDIIAETASDGATSSGNIATVSFPMTPGTKLKDQKRAVDPYGYGPNSSKSKNKYTKPYNKVVRDIYESETMKAKQVIKEDISTEAAHMEKDHEVQMARADLYKAAKYAIELHQMLKNITEAEGLEGWVQAKITKAADYLSSVKHYMEYENLTDYPSAQESVEEGFKIRDKSRGYGVSDKTYKTREEAEKARLLKMASTGGDWEIIKEKAMSKSQQQAAAIALKHKKAGTKPESGTASAEMMSMSTKELEKYAGTKHKGLPKTANETTAGGMASVAMPIGRRKNRK